MPNLRTFAMYLLLDLSEADRLHVALFTDTEISHTMVPGRNRELLSAVHDALRSRGLTPADVRGIMVVVGTGSFTSTRIATTVANMWTYVFRVPLLAITATHVDRVQSLIPTLLAEPAHQYLTPLYSGEPSVRMTS